MKNKIFYTILVLLILSLTKIIYAQDITPSIHYYLTENLNYPIRELDNCSNKKECYLYCQIPANKAICWSYAKFINQDIYRSHSHIQKNQLFLFPISQLGNCSSLENCKKYCSILSNHAACTEFAQAKGIGIIANISKTELLKYIELELGCSSLQQCENVCNQKKSKCNNIITKYTQMIKDKNIQRSNDIINTHSCQDDSTCISYCKNNPNECINLNLTHQYTFISPNGCKNEFECNSYCSVMPGICPGYPNTTVIPIQQVAGVQTKKIEACEQNLICNLQVENCKCSSITITPSIHNSSAFQIAP